MMVGSGTLPDNGGGGTASVTGAQQMGGLRTRRQCMHAHDRRTISGLTGDHCWQGKLRISSRGVDGLETYSSHFSFLSPHRTITG